MVDSARPKEHVSDLDEISYEVLERVSGPGPRYTSYPTAPEWQGEFTEASVLPHLQRANAEADKPVSLYVHLPFCASMCWFCGCSVVVSHKPDRADPYLERIELETERWAQFLPDRRQVDQLHWGGGTPTFLTVPRLRRLFEILFSRFELSDDAEVSLEVDPRITSRAQLEALRELGFNRLSMGIQDFQPDVQAAINRIQPEAQTQAIFEWARDLGFGGINVDLIYGLPQQTLPGFEDTIERVLALQPDRVAVFGYAHVPWLKAHQKRIDTEALPEPATRFELYRAAWRGFLGAGYRAIGMDHFAKPDDELAVALDSRTLHRNFQGYTTRAGRDLIGLGATGIGNIAGAYAQNHKSLLHYYRALDTGTLATHRGISLSRDDEIRRDLITTLLCNFELNEDELAARWDLEFDTYFAADLSRLQRFTDEGVVERSGGVIRVPPRGRIFIRNVGMCFDAFLHRKGASLSSATSPRFSQTI